MFFYKYFENASRNSLSLYLRCLLMVLEINKAIMYLKIRSSFTITKKKRQNTPNVPELGGMTHMHTLLQYCTPRIYPAFPVVVLQ